MELAAHQRSPPPRSTTPSNAPQPAPIHDQRCGIDKAKRGPHGELGMPEAEDGNKGLCQRREHDGADECPRHGAGEGEVVVGGGEAWADVRHRGAVDEDVVGGLQWEGLLDFGVGRDEEVQEWDEEER